MLLKYVLGGEGLLDKWEFEIMERRKVICQKN